MTAIVTSTVQFLKLHAQRFEQDLTSSGATYAGGKDIYHECVTLQNNYRQSVDINRAHKVLH